MDNPVFKSDPFEDRNGNSPNDDFLRQDGLDSPSFRSGQSDDSFFDDEFYRRQQREADRAKGEADFVSEEDEKGKSVKKSAKTSKESKTKKEPEEVKPMKRNAILHYGGLAAMRTMKYSGLALGAVVLTGGTCFITAAVCGAGAVVNQLCAMQDKGFTKWKYDTAKSIKEWWSGKKNSVTRTVKNISEDLRAGYITINEATGKRMSREEVEKHEKSQQGEKAAESAEKENHLKISRALPNSEEWSDMGDKLELLSVLSERLETCFDMYKEQKDLRYQEFLEDNSYAQFIDFKKAKAKRLDDINKEFRNVLESFDEKIQEFRKDFIHCPSVIADGNAASDKYWSLNESVGALSDTVRKFSDILDDRKMNDVDKTEKLQDIVDAIKDQSGSCEDGFSAYKTALFSYAVENAGDVIGRNLDRVRHSVADMDVAFEEIIGLRNKDRARSLLPRMAKIKGAIRGDSSDSSRNVDKILLDAERTISGMKESLALSSRYAKASGNKKVVESCQNLSDKLDEIGQVFADSSKSLSSLSSKKKLQAAVELSYKIQEKLDNFLGSLNDSQKEIGKLNVKEETVKENFGLKKSGKENSYIPFANNNSIFKTSESGKTVYSGSKSAEKSKPKRSHNDDYCL